VKFHLIKQRDSSEFRQAVNLESLETVDPGLNELRARVQKNKVDSSNEKMSFLVAFTAMRVFLQSYYERGQRQSKAIGHLLDELQPSVDLGGWRRWASLALSISSS
jgi:hypothetical protein